jgi:hypothetical protein
MDAGGKTRLLDAIGYPVGHGPHPKMHDASAATGLDVEKDLRTLHGGRGLRHRRVEARRSWVRWDPDARALSDAPA